MPSRPRCLGEQEEGIFRTAEAAGKLSFIRERLEPGATSLPRRYRDGCEALVL